MNNCKLSIIVPIYNCEKYLEKCLNSLLNQTYTNIEIILVNDGSYDNSEIICKKYFYDKRVKYIFQENQGVSSARNNGLKIATGNYITFVDSDDYVDIDGYYNIFASIQDYYDYIIYDLVEYYNEGKYILDDLKNTKTHIVYDYNALSPESVFEIAGCVTRCFYRKDIIKSNNLLFNESMRFSEDREFNLRYLLKCRSIKYIPVKVYYRSIHENSTVFSYKRDKFNLVKNSNVAINIILKDNYDVDYIKYYTIAYCHSYYSCIKNVFHKENGNSLKNKYLELKNILSDEIVSSAFEYVYKTQKKYKWFYEKRNKLLTLRFYLEQINDDCNNHLLSLFLGKCIYYLYKGESM